MSDTSAAQNEALGALRPLVAAEDARTTALNGRALGVISASSVVTAIAAFFAKDVLTGDALATLGDSKKAAVWILIAAVVLLATAVISGVRALWPRSKDFISPDGLEDWANPQGQAIMDAEAIRTQTLRDLAAYLTSLRAFNGGKVKRLRLTYVLYALAVLVIAIDAVLFFEAALGPSLPAGSFGLAR
jgi:hypothetical protein